MCTARELLCFRFIDGQFEFYIKEVHNIIIYHVYCVMFNVLYSKIII